MLERQYTTAITTAGVAISAGSIAADVAISLIPVAGPAVAGAKSVSAQAAKAGTKGADESRGEELRKECRLDRSQGRRNATPPRGDQQLQFEITAVFGLRLADLHGMNLDKDQAQALVLGLTNERVSQQLIATMASDVAETTADGSITTEQRAMYDRMKETVAVTGKIRLSRISIYDVRKASRSRPSSGVGRRCPSARCASSWSHAPSATDSAANPP